MRYCDWGRAVRRLACGLLVAGAGASAAPITVPVLAQESIPPKWILQDGVAIGLCPDVLAALERIEPRLHFAGYDRGRSLPVIEDALESGKAALACGLIESAHRQRIAIRSQLPLYDSKMRLAALASDRQVVDTLDDLVRLKPLINTARGSGYIADLKARGIAVDDSTGDNIVNLRKTIAGHGRYTYMNELSLLHLIRSEHLGRKLRVLPAVFGTDRLYFWVSRKADPALAPLLDRAFARLRASGELARIYERWARPQ